MNPQCEALASRGLPGFTVLSSDDKSAGADRATFAGFYARLGADVFTQTLHALESCGEAEEATMEVFSVLWKEWPTTRMIEAETLRALCLIACTRVLVRHSIFDLRFGAKRLQQGLAVGSRPVLSAFLQNASIEERVAATVAASRNLPPAERTLLDSIFPKQMPDAFSWPNSLYRRSTVQRALFHFHHQLISVCRHKSA
jgi:hypothetical protein